MPNAVYFVATLADLKALATASLPNGCRRVVGNPGSNLLPSWYTLFKGITKAEVQPVTVVPSDSTTNVWVADTARTTVASTAPSSAPLFIGQRWMNTALSPVQVYEATGVSSTSDWVRI